MLESTVGAGSTDEPSPSRSPFEPRPEEPVGRSAAFDACVEDIRWVYGSSFDLLPRLEELIRRRLGVAPQSPGAVMVAGLTGPGIRLLVALLATVLFGQWTEIPWGRWAAILAFYSFFDGGNMAMAAPPNAPPPPSIKRVLEDWTALLPTIVRESDLRDLADFTRRWYRLPAVVAAGVAVATVMMLACALFTPAALSELPAGTIVLLAWLLYDFGATPVYWGNVFQRAFMAREARYDHQLFWPSPADSPEVHKVMRKTTSQGFAAGLWITVFLVLTVVLVSWDSPLVLPLAVGFVVIGYLSTFGLAFSNRASVRRIIERSRNQRLAVLRHRIDTFESRFADLSPEESEQLRDLLFLHDKIRDAPKTPATARTLVRTAAALILPTIMFVVTVFGEVSAERILDAILP
jgi:hypothetical protein